MSSAFHVGGESVWGTNGAVEVLVTALRRQAEDRHGPADPLVRFLRAEEELFPFAGRGVFLDGILAGPDDRQRFRGILDAAVAELMASDELSDYGKDWLRPAADRLREQLGPTASTARPR
ncbi:MAG: hypothetical protein K2X87_09025 [Gemmataceae bacterium]|nr:hypothetical protein [Gemmataceae bacterium]